MRIAWLALLAVLVVVIMPSPAHADGAWLDEQPPRQWNTPGADVPEAPPFDPEGKVDPRCLEIGQRPPETDEDREVVKAGWRLVGGFQGGWGKRVITGTSGFDGMCRPLGFQIFVFQNGLFAGTISPVLMDSRSDGSILRVQIESEHRLFVTFARYAEQDPLCCPSRSTFAHYEIDPTRGVPLLILVSTFTIPTQ